MSTRPPDVGEDISAHYLEKMFDCVCLTMAATALRTASGQFDAWSEIFSRTEAVFLGDRCPAQRLLLFLRHLSLNYR